MPICLCRDMPRVGSTQLTCRIVRQTTAVSTNQPLHDEIPVYHCSSESEPKDHESLFAHVLCVYNSVRISALAHLNGLHQTRLTNNTVMENHTDKPYGTWKGVISPPSLAPVKGSQFFGNSLGTAFSDHVSGSLVSVRQISEVSSAETVDTLPAQGIPENGSRIAAFDLGLRVSITCNVSSTEY
jgi:hypothetical protein